MVKDIDLIAIHEVLLTSRLPKVLGTWYVIEHTQHAKVKHQSLQTKINMVCLAEQAA